MKTKIHLALTLALLSTLAAQRAGAAASVVDLAIFKVASTNLIQINQQVRFFLTLSNGGPGVVTPSAISVTDLLPAGLQFVSSTGNGAYNPNTGIWSVVPGFPHNTNLLTITALAITAGLYTNTAAIVPAPTIFYETNLNNNTSSVVVLVTPILGGATSADSSDFTVNTTGVSPIIGGASFADSGDFTLNTTGVSPIIGGASYSDSADFTLNTTGVSPIIGGASYSDSGDFVLNTTGVSLVIGGATFADSIDFTLDTGGIRPFSLTGTFKLAGGAFQFSFSNAAGARFSVFGVTNPAVPFSNWTFLGTLTDSPPGQFQFTDPQGSNYPQRFYRVTSP